MRIQCNCGVKYDIEITPDMARNPIRFVCGKCGLDSSEVVNSLIRQQLQASATPPAEDPAPTPAPRPQAIPTARLAVPVAAPAGACPTAEDGAPVQSCPKHPQQAPVDSCRVCGKPICPKCMELFGYVCSPLCRARATSMGTAVPVYAGQKSVMEARKWRIIGWSAGAISGALALLLGVWFWYVWFGCAPKVVFSVSFPERSYSGQSVFAGKQHDQVVFLHGDTLARHDLKSKQKVWSRELLDRKRMAAEVEQDLKRIGDINLKLADQGMSRPPRSPSVEELQSFKERVAAAALQLHVHGDNIWVVSPEKVALYDWNTGKETRVFQAGAGEIIPRGEEVFLLDPSADTPRITRIDLLTGASETNELSAMAGVQGEGTLKHAALSLLSQGAGRQALDPAKLAEQVQNLPVQTRLALPALLAARMNQERLEAELDDMPIKLPTAGEPQRQAGPSETLIPTRNGLLVMKADLIESHVIERVAMKAAPAKSVLDGNLKASQTLDAANEILNDMQRSRGGDKVREDLSRYGVSVQTLDSKDSWMGEVIGPPRVIPLKSVNVLVSSKSILVLDKSLKKLWQNSLSYDVPLGGGEFAGDDEGTPVNVGPCIERKDSLYVFDEGVLSAFDLKTGNARWRLPTVGIGAVFFDDQDMMYVNTTTAGHERIKYSRQIDLNDTPGAVMLKVDSRNGKVLWSNGANGWVSQITGKYIFAVSSYTVPEREEALRGTSFETGFEKPPFLRIRRINPKTGKAVWEHFEQRAPLDLQFEGTFIRLIFRKEVEILKFMSL